MYIVVAQRNKSHKVGYSQARWYFSRKRDAITQYNKALITEDRHGALMYYGVEISKIANGTYEQLR